MKRVCAFSFPHNQIRWLCWNEYDRRCFLYKGLQNVSGLRIRISQSVQSQNEYLHFNGKASGKPNKKLLRNSIIYTPHIRMPSTTHWANEEKIKTKNSDDALHYILKLPGFLAFAHRKCIIDQRRGRKHATNSFFNNYLTDATAESVFESERVNLLYTFLFQILSLWCLLDYVIVRFFSVLQNIVYVIFPIYRKHRLSD